MIQAEERVEDPRRKDRGADRAVPSLDIGDSLLVIVYSKPFSQ